MPAAIEAGGALVTVDRPQPVDLLRDAPSDRPDGARDRARGEADLASTRTVPLIWFQCTDDVDATRALRARAGWARDHGAEPHGAERLSYLALVEFHAGRWDLADRMIEESCKTIEERLEVSGRFAFPFAWRAFMDAHHGRLVRARATLEPLVQETLRGAKAWWAVILLSTLGFVQFAAGDVRAADRALPRCVSC
jgi:hypothetical protein